MSKFAFGRARGVRYSQPLRFEELEDRRMLSLTGDAPSPYPSASHSSGIASRLGASQSTDDGVVIGSIRPGQNNVSITVDVQGTSASRLDAWIDFNRDGSLSGPWEQIVNSKLLSTGSVHTVTFDVPAWAEIGSTWARFRISTAGNMPVGSSEPNGETEDYLVTILPPASNLGTFGGQKIVDDSPLGAIAAKPIFAADFDGDGDTDLVAATGSGDDVAWRRNNGNNTFTNLVVGSANDVRSVVAADVNGDDRMDVVAVSAADNAVYWYQNDGTPETGAWTRATISNAASGVRSVFAADVDRDGDMDVVAAAFSSDKVAWHENNGSQSFTERIVNVPDTDTNSGNGNGDVDAPSAIYVADINRDGHLDVVTASSVDGKVVWYQNDGTPATGAWTQRTIRSSVSAMAEPAEVSVVIADMNGDGNMDVVTANFAEDGSRGSKMTARRQRELGRGEISPRRSTVHRPYLRQILTATATSMLSPPRRSTTRLPSTPTTGMESCSRRPPSTQPIPTATQTMPPMATLTERRTSSSPILITTATWISSPVQPETIKLPGTRT
jgi:hypothetical protein